MYIYECNILTKATNYLLHMIPFYRISLTGHIW